MSKHGKELCVEYYAGEEANINDTKKWLASFEGGSVTCLKDENRGIAEIILDHPNKRNAMSG